MDIRRLLGGMLVMAVLGFTGCDTGGGSVLEEEEIDDGKTRVNFDNAGNVFPVSVYSDSLRATKLADIEAGDAKRIETIPTLTGAVFYVTYHITTEGITFPYYDGDSFMMARVDEARTTRVPVPALEQGEVNRVYVKITNNGASSLTFRKENGELTPEGASSTIVMNGETAVYAIDAGSSSGYAFMRNSSSPLSFPDDLSAFETGHIYSFTLSGSAALELTSTTPLAIADIIAAFCRLTWSGDWIRTGENTYTSNPIGHNQSTTQVLTITTNAPRQITVELTASSEANYDKGRAYPLNNASSTPVIEVSGNEKKTHTYTVPPGTHTIYFTYAKDASHTAGSDTVTVKILSIE